MTISGSRRLYASQVAKPHHAPLPGLVDLRPGNRRGAHVHDVPGQDLNVTEAVPFDTPQAHLVEESLIPYQVSLEVVAATPPQLRPDRIAELEGDVPDRIDGGHVVDVALSDPEVQARVLAEASGFAGRRAVVQRGDGQDERAADDDAGESQGLAAETKQQRHHQHREVQDELRAVGDRYAPEQAGRQAEPACLPARELDGPVAGPQGSEKKRQ